MEKTQLLAALKDNIDKYCEQNFNFKFDKNNPKIRLQETTFGSAEIFAALETLLSTYTTMGKQVKAFERQYADYVGGKYAVMSNSGSSNNLLAIAALSNPCTREHLRPGDEVIVPALSWSTTIWPVVQHNLIPVFVDCDQHSFNFDLEKLEKAIGPKTRAIKLVHVYGNPCDMDAILALAKKYNLYVIEDCCEAMGASYRNQAVGTFGLVGTYSFFFAHQITTLEGGIAVSDDFEFVETMRVMRAHGWSREADEHQKYVNLYPHIDPRFIFINMGYNLRPTELNAAMGSIQLSKLDHYNDLRRQAAQKLIDNLSCYEEYFQFQQETPHGKHVWFGFPILLKDTAPFSVQDITAYLQQHHIETRPIIAGNMARHPGMQMYPHRIAGDLSTADRVMQQGFTFACHHAIDADACDYISNTIHSFMQQQTRDSLAIIQDKAI